MAEYQTKTRFDKKDRFWTYYLIHDLAREGDILSPDEWETTCNLVTVEVRSKSGKKKKVIEYTGCKAQSLAEEKL